MVAMVCKFGSHAEWLVEGVVLGVVGRVGISNSTGQELNYLTPVNMSIFYPKLICTFSPILKQFK